MARSASRSSKPRDEKHGIDRAFDRFLRFGNDQIPGAKPQRNVVQELFDNLGRGRAGLRGDLVPPSTDFRREPQQRGATLREGMSGPQVKALQDDLVRAGLLKPGEATGKFAGATAAAVRQLEQMHGLNRDAGVAGRQVLGQLRGNAMPPPVPQSRPTTAAPTTRTTTPPRSTEPVPTRSPPPVTQQNLPPPVTANPTPIPQPSPTPQVTAPVAQPDPLQTALDAAAARATADRAAADAQRTAPTPSPEWQSYIESQRTGPTYVPPSPSPPPRDFTLESEAKLNAPNPVQGNPQGLTLDQIGRPPDMALWMGEDRGMQGWPPQAPPAPSAALLDRQAAAQQQAAKTMEDAQRIANQTRRDAGPLVAQPATPPMPPAPTQQTTATPLPGLGRPLDLASGIGQALGGMGGLGPAFQQLVTGATPATAPPAGMTPIVDRSVMTPGFNADPLGGKEQGRLGSSYGPRGGPLSSAELPPGYQPPLPPRADIAFNAPSLSPAAPKGGPGGVMSPAALASLPGSGMLASQEARPSIRADNAQAALPPLAAPRLNDLQTLLNLPGGSVTNPGAVPGGRQGGGSLTMADRGAGSPPQPGPLSGYNVMPGQRLSDVPFLSPSINAAPPIPTVQPPAAPATRSLGNTEREVPAAQREAELPAAMMNRIDDMKAGLAGPFSNPPLPADMALRAGEDAGMRGGMPAMGSGLGQTTIGTANDPFPGFFNNSPGMITGDRANEPRPSQYEAPTGAFLGDLGGTIPTVQAPPVQDIVQPQVGDQGGQGLLGGQGFGDQTQVEAPAPQSDQGILEAISEISIGSNQQDQQPGGDQSATASAASGDNTGGLTGGQLTDEGLLAMLEAMFNSGGNTMSAFR